MSRGLANWGWSDDYHTAPKIHRKEEGKRRGAVRSVSQMRRARSNYYYNFTCTRLCRSFSLRFSAFFLRLRASLRTPSLTHCQTRHSHSTISLTPPHLITDKIIPLETPLTRVSRSGGIEVIEAIEAFLEETEFLDIAESWWPCWLLEIDPIWWARA